ncbi:MAG: NADH-quinone oxidoreductase subunit H [Methylotenera sp.]|nr:NADH-quinone oxidoreductase subunit H [Oligoflexia bacterium]
MITAWQSILNLPEHTPHAVVMILVLIISYLFVVLPCSLIMAFMERKLSADLQARVGPNRSGPAGFFQPVSDALKLMQKVDSPSSNRAEAIWLGIAGMALYSTVAVLPLGSLILLVDTDMSVFLPFWGVIVLTFATLMMGLTQDTVSGWLGGLRTSLRGMAGVFPALIAVLCAGLPAGGFSWSHIAAAQSAAPYHWTAFNNPFGAISLIVFLMSGMIVLGVAPLDGAISFSELRGGTAAHLSGPKLGMFRLSRFYGMFLWCVMAVVLFLGGWSIPEGLTEALRDSNSFGVIVLIELFVLLIKTFAVMLLIVMFSQVTPRMRVDQVTDLNWKVLSPFSLISLVGFAFWTAWLHG